MGRAATGDYRGRNLWYPQSPYMVAGQQQRNTMSTIPDERLPSSARFSHRYPETLATQQDSHVLAPPEHQRGHPKLHQSAHAPRIPYWATESEKHHNTEPFIQMDPDSELLPYSQYSDNVHVDQLQESSLPKTYGQWQDQAYSSSAGWGPMHTSGYTASPLLENPSETSKVQYRGSAGSYAQDWGLLSSLGPAAPTRNQSAPPPKFRPLPSAW